MINTVLVLAPHTDDAELGCGGYMVKLKRKGAKIIVATFAINYPCIPNGKNFKKEAFKATKVLGIELKVFDYKAREFPLFRQLILDEMIELKNQIQPDLVIMPSTNDIHQDHQVINQEGIRAFKHLSMLGYEMPWNNIGLNGNYYVKLEPDDMEQQIKALKCYKTSLKKNYMNDRYIWNLAEVRGMQIGCEYAECFEVIRWVN